jgi:hypothetical protein
VTEVRAEVRAMRVDRRSDAGSRAEEDQIAPEEAAREHAARGELVREGRHEPAVRQRQRPHGSVRFRGRMGGIVEDHGHDESNLFRRESVR